jgi:hypothetical protein
MERASAGGRSEAGRGHHRGRFGGDAQRPQSEIAADVDHQAAYRRMQLHMLVGVGMVKRQAGRREGGELGVDFSRKLTANRRAEEVSDAESKLVGRKPPLCIDKARNVGSR